MGSAIPNASNATVLAFGFTANAEIGIMTKFNNDSSPAERHRVLFKDTTRQPTTYRDSRS
jgi:hypothetical protein